MIVVVIVGQTPRRVKQKWSVSSSRNNILESEDGRATSGRSSITYSGSYYSCDYNSEENNNGKVVM